MEFRFGMYTEVTDLMFEMYPSLKNDGYERFFICPHTNDYWVCRILKGFDKEYGGDEDSYLLERNKIERWHEKNVDYTLSRIKKALTMDFEDGGNWDFEQSYNVDELIEMIDGGYGILNLKK